MSDTLTYERDPRRIYDLSFRRIREAIGSRDLPDGSEALAIRLVHACGMVDVLDDLRVSPGALATGRAAIRKGAPIFCDSEMVARGVITRALPDRVPPRVTLNYPAVPALAEALGTTRSAAAVELWRDQIEGSVVAIGNAPTALFHLLEGLAKGWPKPALILGFPVGFVGAAESKDALHTCAHGIPYATVLGSRGGSAMAAAAVNALTLGLEGDGT